MASSYTFPFAYVHTAIIPINNQMKKRRLTNRDTIQNKSKLKAVNRIYHVEPEPCMSVPMRITESIPLQLLLCVLPSLQKHKYSAAVALYPGVEGADVEERGGD